MLGAQTEASLDPGVVLGPLTLRILFSLVPSTSGVLRALPHLVVFRDHSALCSEITPAVLMATSGSAKGSLLCAQGSLVLMIREGSLLLSSGITPAPCSRPHPVVLRDHSYFHAQG